MSTLLSGYRARFFKDGAVLVAGKVYFYENETTTLKTIYTDSALDTAAANPATTDANGEIEVHLGPGLYTLSVYSAVLPGGALVSSTDGVGIFGLSDIYQLTQAEEDSGLDETEVDFQYPELDVRRYGAIADGATDCQPAVTAAIAVAVEYGGGEVTFPPGVCRFATDLLIRDHVSLRGQGNGTVLEFNGCALKFDAVAALDPDVTVSNLVGFRLDNIRIKRIGTAGYAVQFITTGGTGAGDNRDVVRFTVDRLYIVSSTGGGVSITGTYICDFYNLIVRTCTGIGLSVEQQSGSLVTALNAANFWGGEIQDCTQAMDLNRCRGVNFYGMCVEGNDLGIDINTGSNINFIGGYYEANGSAAGHYDFRIGNDVSGAPDGVSIIGVIFNAGALMDYSILPVRCMGLFIKDCSFKDYVTAGINGGARASSSSVTGDYGHCLATGTTPAVAASDNRYFHGAVGSEFPRPDVIANSTSNAPTNAVTAHALNATFSDTEVESALNALGVKINAVGTAAEAIEDKLNTVLAALRSQEIIET